LVKQGVSLMSLFNFFVGGEEDLFLVAGEIG